MKISKGTAGIENDPIDPRLKKILKFNSMCKKKAKKSKKEEISLYFPKKTLKAFIFFNLLPFLVYPD